MNTKRAFFHQQPTATALLELWTSRQQQAAEARKDSGNIKYCTLIIIVMASVFILSDLQREHFLG